MKKLKKALAMILSLAMVLGMSATVFAADNVVGNSDDTGIIVVNGVDNEDGVQVKAYPIVTAKYDANGNFSGYENKYGLKNIEAPTETELAAIAENVKAETPITLNKKIDGNNAIYTNGPLSASESATGEAVEEIPMGIGMYLIIVDGSEMTVYNPAVASINYKNENGSNVIGNGDLTMGTTIDGTNLWVKKSDQPGLDKTVRNTSDDNDNTVGETEITGNKGNTTDIGDLVTYDVTINPIPNYGGKFPVLNVVDTLSEGLTYKEDTLKVFIVNDSTVEEELTAVEDYTLDVKGQVITVDFVVDGAYTLNDYAVAGKKVVIEYKATLNENAKINSIGNDNTAVLNYSKNSTIEGDVDDDEKETHTYTFDIDGTVNGEYGNVNTQHIINKIGELVDTETIPGETVKEPVKNAKFGLFIDADATVKYVNKKVDGTTHWDSQNIMTDSLGQTYMTGLDAGTYYLKELEAPAPYSVNTHIFKIVIDATLDSATGLLSSWKVTIDDKDVASFTIDHVGKTIEKVLKPDRVENETPFDGFNIENTKLSSLPSTGGIGTTIFTIGGCIIMIAAAALFFASRKKSAK